MGVDVYGSEGSPACRAVFLVAKAIGLDYTLKPINPMAGETRTPEYLRMNPGHTIPTMDDDGLYLGESRAIITYFISKYAPDSALYPRDPVARALVDQRLFFDVDLFAALKGALAPLLFAKDLKKYEANLPKVDERMDLLEKFLTKSPYVAGDQLTVADLTLLANVSTMDAGGMDLSKWPRVQKWLAKLKTLPYYSANAVGAKHLGDMFKKSMFEARKAKFSS